MADVEGYVVTDEHHELAEGPVWDAASGRVLWVDIPTGEIMEGRLLTGAAAGPSDGVTGTGQSVRAGGAGSPADRSGTGRVRVEVVARHRVPGTAGAVVPTLDGGRLVAGQRGPIWVTPGGVLHHGPDLLPAGVASRLNDATCDPAGRLLVGSLALDGRTGDERLYRIDADASVHVLDDGFTLSNGLAVAPDGATLYHVDSVPGIVWRRSYDAGTGGVGARHEAFRPDGGIPDGLCVDVDGNLWIAMSGPGQVRCYRPDGRLLGVVATTAPQTSSVAFVGPGRDRLLITTARELLSPAQLAAFPDSGRLFVADVGTRGLATTVWAGSSERAK